MFEGFLGLAGHEAERDEFVDPALIARGLDGNRSQLGASAAPLGDHQRLAPLNFAEVCSQAAQAQNRSLGYEPAVVFVPHPIQDRTDAEMRALADQAFEAILKAVTA